MTMSEKNRQKYAELMVHVSPEMLHERLFKHPFRTIGEVAREFRVPQSLITKLYKDYHRERPDLFPKSKHRKLSLEERFTIDEARKYWGIVPAETLAKEHGVSTNRMYVIIGKYRKQRPDWFPKPESKTDQVTPADLISKSYQEIMKETGLSKTQIYLLRKQYGLVGRKMSDEITPELLAQAIEDGVSISALALANGKTYQRIYDFARQHGLHPISNGQKSFYRRLTPGEKEEIQELREAGNTSVQIAQILGLSPITVLGQYRYSKHKRPYARGKLSQPVLELALSRYTPEEIAEIHGLPASRVHDLIAEYQIEAGNF